VIETPKYSTLVVQMCPKQIQDGGHLEKSKNLNIVATDWPILTKFGTVMWLGPPGTAANEILQIRK